MSKKKREKKRYGKSWNSNKKDSETLPPKQNILSIFQLFQCGDECVFIMFRRRTLDEIASDEYKELRFPAIVITFCALPFNAMTFSVHIKLLCSVKNKLKMFRYRAFARLLQSRLILVIILTENVKVTFI